MKNFLVFAAGVITTVIAYKVAMRFIAAGMPPVGPQLPPDDHNPNPADRRSSEVGPIGGQGNVH